MTSRPMSKASAMLCQNTLRSTVHFIEQQARELAGLAQRAMQLQVTVQDGSVWVGNGQSSVELHPARLFGAA